MIISDSTGYTEDIKGLSIPIFYKRGFWYELSLDDRKFTGTLDRDLMSHPFFSWNLDNFQVTPTLTTVIGYPYRQETDFGTSTESAIQQFEISFYVKEMLFPKYGSIVSFVEPITVIFELVGVKEI